MLWLRAALLRVRVLALTLRGAAADVTNYASFQGLQRWIDKIAVEAEEGCALVIVGNKGARASSAARSVPAAPTHARTRSRRLPLPPSAAAAESFHPFISIPVPFTTCSQSVAAGCRC